ncbi:tail fiber domain-containing protein [Hymenobacter monticola]|uniref:Tail fiber domain-containing protein n=1 Tax=Hymenobacter monticola TaxID=1705399 RepID=A0ABY4B5F2_9BACT|nr:tail fiber domain-containing protein [Hymenobacter monticola]UOE34373.1 tail fiber domain-containing protein [Hymenobacter monticola]
MKYLYLLAASLLATTSALAQTTPGGVRIGTPGAPDAAAALDISATGKGLLIPRMDSATRAGIAAPPDGLMVFQTDGRQGFWYCVGGAWLYIPDKTRSGDNLGNHTATRNLNLANNRLVGGSATTPGVSGLRIDGNGLVRLSMQGVRPSGNYDNGLGLHVLDADAGFLVRTGIGLGPLTPPATGQGDRLMWSSFYSALRAGGVDGAQWDGSNLGFYSAAFGYNTLAAGNYSLGAGYGIAVRGSYSAALGYVNAIDFTSSAAFAFGRNCRIKGNYSVAGGFFSKAQGNLSLAWGERCNANANNAIALGRFASANARTGTLVLADAAGNDSLRASANNQFSARYVGGYRLYTNIAQTVGVQIAAGGNSWTVISDSTKKELRRLADGNRFLARIDGMRLGSWNYKGQDPGTMRHYGPMAQDFYAAFGHDGVGTIGNDSTINQSDFDGVNLIAIQALYRRVRALEAENAALRRQQPAPAAQAAAAAALEERLRRLEALVGGQAQR